MSLGMGLSEIMALELKTAEPTRQARARARGSCRRSNTSLQLAPQKEAQTSDASRLTTYREKRR